MIPLKEIKHLINEAVLHYFKVKVTVIPGSEFEAWIKGLAAVTSHMTEMTSSSVTGREQGDVTFVLGDRIEMGSKTNVTDLGILGAMKM